jgi:hypothetical protein
MIALNSSGIELSEKFLLRNWQCVGEGPLPEPNPGFLVNPDSYPAPGFDDQKFKKFPPEIFFFFKCFHFVSMPT